jgi:hypothetical protein
MAFLGVLAFFALVLPALAANRINYIPGKYLYLLIVHKF